MPGKKLGNSGGVRTTWEVTAGRQIAGAWLFESLERYDELERHEAEVDFEATALRLRAEVGQSVNFVTDGGFEVIGIVDRVWIELRSRKVGEYASPARLERIELAGEPAVSATVAAVRDGLLMVEPGRRAAVFRAALASIKSVPVVPA